MIKYRPLLPLVLLLTAQIASRALPVSFPANSLIAAVDKPGDMGSTFTVGEETQVPGKTLKKGDYTIRVVDHLSDRMVVEVSRDGKTQSMFLALPSPGISKGASTGPITLGAGAAKGKGAFRGFAFPDGTVAEFVYPKAEAVGLAKANNTKIPAIDPESQGLKGNPALSKQDREMVTLWLLSPTLVAGDSKPGIAAERYQAGTSAASVATPTPTKQVAAAPVASRRETVSPVAAAPQEVSSVNLPQRPAKAKPLMKTLPHTAGTTPLVWLMGLCTLIGAGLMTTRRLSAGY